MVILWYFGLDSEYDLENEKLYGEEFGVKYWDLLIFFWYDVLLVEESLLVNF